jgi:hypothetical protein
MLKEGRNAVAQELTMSEVLRDPLIRQLLRADGIPLGSFALMLEKAANRRNTQVANGTTPNDPATNMAQAIWQ